MVKEKYAEERMHRLKESNISLNLLQVHTN